MSIFGKKDSEKQAEQETQGKAPLPDNVEYLDEPANPKNIASAAPGAPMNESAADQLGAARQATAEESTGKSDDERRHNVEPF